jgi:hypothetical protein
VVAPTGIGTDKPGVDCDEIACVPAVAACCNGVGVGTTGGGKLGCDDCHTLCKGLGGGGGGAIGVAASGAAALTGAAATDDVLTLPGMGEGNEGGALVGPTEAPPASWALGGRTSSEPAAELAAAAFCSSCALCCAASASSRCRKSVSGSSLSNCAALRCRSFALRTYLQMALFPIQCILSR